MILEIINTFLSLIPFVNTGKVKISTNLIFLEFLIHKGAGYHWAEENYKNEPFRYKLKCNVEVFNGKRITAGINNCSFNLKCIHALADTDKIEGTFKTLENIPSNERRETEIYQEGIIFFSENLSNGFTLTFNYYINGKKKEKELIVKKA